MRTRIVAAFPGTGKSSYNRLYPEKILDLDSKKYQWLDPVTREVNPDFPNNYISIIKESIGKYEVILVSTQKRVRDALIDNCLFFYLVYPDGTRKA